MRTLLCASVLSLCLWSMPLNAAVYQAPDPEPTAEETLILEYMNRFRADPKAECAKILAHMKSGQAGWVARGVDLDMFQREVEALKPSPPLVMSLQLLDSARKHSYYMTKNGLTHGEEKGKDGYVHESFSGRIKAAGYTGSSGGENCYATAPDAWGSHVGFIVDSGPGGPGGMQPGRGHRTNMHKPGFKEVGPGAVPYNSGRRGSRFSVTHNFGSRRTRFVGGVIYKDKNGNGFYDLDEGVGGVTIVGSDGSSVKSWKHGGYALPLKGNGAVTITAGLGSHTFSKDFAAGSDNVKFDWIVPDDAEIEIADKLLAKVDGISNEQQRFSALVDLHMQTQHLNVDPKRRTRLNELTKDVGPKVDAAMKETRAILNNLDPMTYKNKLLDLQKPYASTGAASWFKEALVVADAKAAFQNFKLKCETDKQLRPQVKRQFVTFLEDTAKKLEVSEFSSEVKTLAAEAKPIADPSRYGGGRRRR